MTDLWPWLNLAGPTRELVSEGSLAVALAAIGVHTFAMLLATGVVAVMVYEWLGLAFLRRGWINQDAIWIAALVAAGGVLLVT